MPITSLRFFSSIARAIKKNKLSSKIVSSNRSDLINKKVIELKIVDDSSSDTKKMAEGSDLIIIATPLSSYKDVILKIKDSLKSGSILTDVGSVKENIIGLIEKNIPKNTSWISSHPIAGTEESGPESGFSELFQNRWCILTPSKKSNDKDIKLLETFWKKRMYGKAKNNLYSLSKEAIITLTQFTIFQPFLALISLIFSLIVFLSLLILLIFKYFYAFDFVNIFMFIGISSIFLIALIMINIFILSCLRMLWNCF